MKTIKMLLSVFQWIKFVFFVRKLKKVIQAEVLRIPTFKEGAIQLLFAPKCDEADMMMFGIGRDCERKFIFPARFGYSHTRPAGYRGSDEAECDCSGYAALKIQGAAYAVKHKLGDSSEDMPDENVTWGRENDPGCICYVIYDLRDKEFMRIYVSVSGADSDEDKACAKAARPVIFNWCLRYNKKIVSISQ